MIGDDQATQQEAITQDNHIQRHGNILRGFGDLPTSLKTGGQIVDQSHGLALGPPLIHVETSCPNLPLILACFLPEPHDLVLNSIFVACFLFEDFIVFPHVYCFFFCSCKFIKNVGLLQDVLETKILLIGNIPCFRDALIIDE